MMNLVPLSIATRHVYLSVEGYAPNTRPQDRFNRIGRLMASLGGLYSVEGGAPRALSKEEIAEGVLHQGDVHVTHDCIKRAIGALRGF